MTRKRGRPKRDRSGELKAHLVDAAMEEFAREGYRGARIEAIARRAGCNRAMIYFYFDGKQRLFQAALDEVFKRRMAQMAAQPASLAEGLIYWFRQIHSDPISIRLAMQEVIADEPASQVRTSREIYLAKQLEVVREFQAKGLVRADLDARDLLTLFAAITTFPPAFPVIASISLGAEDEQDMAAKWSAAIERLATVLIPAGSNQKDLSP
jgi:AcrR family transcriptional regulator